MDTPFDVCISNNKKVADAIKAEIELHESKWPKLRNKEILSWTTHYTTIASLICLALYIISLFFLTDSDRITVRVIVEACIFLCCIVFNFFFRLLTAWSDHRCSTAPVKRILNNFELDVYSKIEDVTSQLDISTITRIVKLAIERQTRKYRKQHPMPIDRILLVVRHRIIFVVLVSSIISFLVATIRVATLSGAIRSQWVNLFFERQIYLVLPLLEFILPVTLFIAFSLQDARILSLFQIQQLVPVEKKVEELIPWSPGGRLNSNEEHSSSSSSSSAKSSKSKPSSSSSSLSSSSFSSESSSDESEDWNDRYTIPKNSLGDLEAARRNVSKLPVPRRTPFTSLVRDYLWRIVSGDEEMACFPRSGLAQVFGNVTTLACVDQRPVREAHPFAEKVLLLGKQTSHARSGSSSNWNQHKSQMQRKQERSPNAGVSGSQHAHETKEVELNVTSGPINRGPTQLSPSSIFSYDHVPRNHKGASSSPVVLHLRRKDEENIEFDDARWNAFLPLLKPLGLNCMLTGAYSETQRHDMDLSDFEEGLRRLSKAIGFSITTADNFEFVHEIKPVQMQRRNTLTSKPPFSLSSSKIFDNPKRNQEDDLNSTTNQSDFETPTTPYPSTTDQSANENPSSDERKKPSDAESKQTEKEIKKSLKLEQNSNQSDDSQIPKNKESGMDESHNTNIETSSKHHVKVDTDNETTDNDGNGTETETQDNPDGSSKTNQNAKETERTAQREEMSEQESKQSQTQNSNTRTFEDSKSAQNPISSTYHPLSTRATYLVVKNIASRNNELLTTGDPDVVLSQCSQYWNGSEIKKLTKGDRRIIKEVVHHWSVHQTFLCVGFAYKPVPSKYDEALSHQAEKAQNIAAFATPKSLKMSNDQRKNLEREILTDRTDQEQDYENELEELKQGQIWVGMVGLRHQPKPIAPLFVDQLDSAHIRFVYFSDENEQRSKVFADKLGLETGWNSFITLKDPTQDEIEANQNENEIQKLPVGISSIRDHLESVDNVPLLVNLFVDATPQNKTEMIKIQKENGEVVICLGTSADPDNIDAFMNSNLTFGLLPEFSLMNSQQNRDTCRHSSPNTASSRGTSIDRKSMSTDDFSHESFSSDSNHPSATKMENKHKHPHKKNPSCTRAGDFLESYGSTGSLVTDILRLSCHLMSRNQQSYVDILELIQFGRKLEQQTVMYCWTFIVSFLTLHFHQLLSNILLVTTTLTGIQLFFLCFLIIPIQSFSLFWSPRPPRLLSLISDKNLPPHRARIIRYSFYAFVRMFPLVLVSLIIFVWTLHFTWTDFQTPNPSTDPTRLQYIFGATKGVASFNPFQQASFYNALSFSQDVMMFSITVYIVVASASCIHRTQGVFQLNPFSSRVWVFASICSLVSQIAFFLISERNRLNLFTHVDPFMYILLFGWIPCQVAVDELVKKFARQHFHSSQEISKLDYNTKLGMHSPI